MLHAINTPLMKRSAEPRGNSHSMAASLRSSGSTSRARRRAVAQSSSTSSSASSNKAAAEPRWAGLNVTKQKLTSVLGGRAVRNVGGVVYTIVAPADPSVTAENISVTDSFGLSYPVHVDEVSGVIKADLANGTGAIAGFALSPSDALKVTGFSRGAELINGRAAMLGFIFAAIGEVRDGLTFGKQLASFNGFTGAIFWSAVAAAGTLAPVATGRKANIDDALPDENDPLPDQPLPYFWTPKAEAVNSKAAMLGLAMLFVVEALTHSPVL